MKQDASIGRAHTAVLYVGLTVAGFGGLVLHDVHAASAGSELAIAVTGLRSESGSVQGVLCTDKEAFPNGCKLCAKAAAKAGGTNLIFKDVPPGRYAFAAFHDEDSNGQLTMSKQGLPAEGIAFGNDAIGPTGLPTFKAAALDVPSATKSTVRLRYFKR
jgi:uncharacterized protein (DUF2141 family)